MALLRSAIVIMILVPFSTAYLLAAFPRETLPIPVWFWVAWFVVSVWAALEAPVRAEWFSDTPGQASRYGKLGVCLGLGNVLWSIVAVIYLGWGN